MSERDLLDCFPADGDNVADLLTGSIAREGDAFYFSSSTETSRGSAVRTSFRVSPVPKQQSSNSRVSAVLVAVATEVARRATSPDADGEEGRFQATYAHTSLSYVDATKLFANLEILMREEQLFLDKDLDLESVCRKLQTNQLYLSQVINFFAEENFRDYLNRKRIDYLEQLGDEVLDMGIGELWRLAGFGSYSAFRRFLQSDRDLTPGAFARRLRQPVKVEV